MKRLSAYGIYKSSTKNKMIEDGTEELKLRGRKSVDSGLMSDSESMKKINATPLKSYAEVNIKERKSSIKKEFKSLMLRGGSSRKRKGRRGEDAFSHSPVTVSASGKKANKKLTTLVNRNKNAEASNGSYQSEDQSLRRYSSETSFTVKRRRRSKSLERISKTLSIRGSREHGYINIPSSKAAATPVNGRSEDVVFANGITDSMLYAGNNDDDDDDEDDDDDKVDEISEKSENSRKRKMTSVKKSSHVESKKSKAQNHASLIVESPAPPPQMIVKKKSDKTSHGKSSHPLSFITDSAREATQLFEHIIKPVSAAKFFKEQLIVYREVWERKPLFIRRHNTEHNTGWFSTTDLDLILRHNRINYTEHLDVVSYSDGKRETHNPVGRAYPAVVWDYYSNGCSVRLLNPQTYSGSVWQRLSLLQEYFSCVAGANIYLTPPGTQGFAPHYDDIEAFVLQLEGKKRWRVYEPRDSSEVLPRFSSGNLTESDLSDPVLDITLEPGDLLYFPRGFIHQGNAVEETHSLHITVSVGQRNTWADLLEKLIPRALEVAVEEDVEFRRSLPRDCFTYMGVAFSDNDAHKKKREEFERIIGRLMDRLKGYAPLDSAVDQVAKKFLEDSLPPCLTEEERECSVQCIERRARWGESSASVINTSVLSADTEIRIVRPNSVRLVSEVDGVCIHHNVENSRLYHETTSKSLEVDAEMAEAVEYILNSYPQFIRVDSLPLNTLEKQVSLAADLYERGLVLTNKPLQPLKD